METVTPDTLYAEAMRLGARARAYFDPGGPADAARAALRPEHRLAVATESLRTTSRLLEVVSALIVRQAGGVPALRERDFAAVPARLGGPAREIAAGVRELYTRTFGEEG